MFVVKIIDMSISVIVVVIIILIVVSVLVVYLIRKPDTDLEIAQATRKKIEKSIRKNKKTIEKISEKLDSYTSNQIKKNDEMLKKIQDNQRQ